MSASVGVSDSVPVYWTELVFFNQFVRKAEMTINYNVMDKPTVQDDDKTIIPY